MDQPRKMSSKHGAMIKAVVVHNLDIRERFFMAVSAFNDYTRLGEVGNKGGEVLPPNVVVCTLHATHTLSSTKHLPSVVHM